MNYQFKRLGKTNLKQLKQLNHLFGEVFEEPQTYHDKAPSDDYLNNLLAKPHLMFVVALDGEKIIGGLAAYLLEKFEQERNEIFVYDLAVHQDYRRQKVATNLLLKTKELGKELNAWTIFIESEDGDEPATKLYQSLADEEEIAHHFDIFTN